MTDASLPLKRFGEGDFSVGQVLNRTFSVLSRNLLPFSVVTAVANLPSLLLFRPAASGGVPSGHTVLLILASVIVAVVLSALAEAVVLFGAFEDMRGRRVDLIASMKVGLSRVLPVLGVALLVGLLSGLSAILLIFPAFIVVTMLFVAMPVCIVEQLGPVASLKRSSQLTKGHRWKIFGLWLLVMIAAGVVSLILSKIAGTLGGPAAAMIVELGWNALAGAFNAVMVVVTYHDLRVAKEGVDTDQIASVFD
jgi:hypothetical protein